MHLVVGWVDIGDPDQVRRLHVPCGADAASATWTIDRAKVDCPECSVKDPGPRATWRPDWRRQYRWPSGNRTGPGSLFKSDGRGGGLLVRRGARTFRKRSLTADPTGTRMSP